MKRTLRDNINDLLDYKKHEKTRLLEEVHECQLEADWEGAMKMDIKMRAVDRFINEIEKALK